MKFVLACFLFTAMGTAWSKADVYCKADRSIINILSKNGWICQVPLLFGEVCFTGERGEAIKILNSSQVNSLFAGTDGEYIENAHYDGRSFISYTSRDDGNEVSEKVSIGRCSADFFRI